ncbi:hypothetical protein PWT90_06796 [Aphanocladium album]|nr:hypothetical protein PWT90_06796 [Aphanocladium album]
MFEAIPNELIFLILSHCDSKRDLHSLIAASPCCYRVFASSPGSVLLPLLRRIVPSALWRDFAAVCRADIFTQTDATTGSIARKEDVCLFLDRYFGSGFDIPSDKASIVAAFRLHATISYFVSDYVNTAAGEIAFLAEHGVDGSACSVRPGRSIRSSSPDSSSLPLQGRTSRTTDATAFKTVSSAEHVRFFRGFLRLELQSRVFRRARRIFPMIPGREQYDLFLRRMPPWAVEELTCAHDYLTRGIWDALHESRRCTSPNDDPRRHFGIDLPFTPPTLQTSAWLVFVSGLLLHGMDFLYDVLVTQKGNRAAGRQPDGRAAASGELKAGSVVSQFLVSALETARYHAEPIPTPELPEDEDDTDGPSWGFCEHVRRARITGRYLPVLQFQAHAAVRATGYVFWDAAKMRSDVMRNAIAGASGMSLEEYQDRYDRQHRRLGI